MAIAIQGLNPDGLWTGNNDDIIISGLTEDIRIKYTVSVGNIILGTFSERYAAVDGVATIRRLGDVAKRYFDFFNPNTLAQSYRWVSFPTIQAVIYNLRGIQIEGFSQKFCYSSILVDSATPADFKRFMTRYTDRTVYPKQSEWLAYMDLDYDFVIAVSYTEQWQVPGYITYGEPKYKEIIIKAGNTRDICIESMSMASIVQRMATVGIHITQDHIISYDAYLKNGPSIMDIVRYTINRDEQICRHDLFYYNVFGVPSVMVLTGQRKRTGEYSGTALQKGRSYHMVEKKLVIKSEAYTGYIDSQSRDAAYDLIVSDYLYRCMDNGSWQSITLLDANISESEPTTEPICLKLTYRTSDDDRQLSFRRLPYGQRVFDNSFDNSFE